MRQPNLIWKLPMKAGKLYTELTLVYTRQTALFTQFEIDVAEHNFCGIESHCKVFIQKALNWIF